MALMCSLVCKALMLGSVLSFSVLIEMAFFPSFCATMETYDEEAPSFCANGRSIDMVGQVVPQRASRFPESHCHLVTKLEVKIYRTSSSTGQILNPITFCPVSVCKVRSKREVEVAKTCTDVSRPTKRYLSYTSARFFT